MNPITIRKAALQDAPIIAALASTIWTEHYTPMIGDEQVRYMLTNLQSPDAIRASIAYDTAYFIAHENAVPLGYLALKPEKSYLFLSKIYILKEYRGRGIARKFIDLAVRESMAMHLPAIRLSVNKHNEDSWRAYEKMDFVRVGSVVNNIGNGFVMDDYIYERDTTRPQQSISLKG